MPTYGLNFRENRRDHSLMKRIDEPLGEYEPKAPRLRSLIGMGLAAEDVLDEYGVEFGDGSEEAVAEAREEFIREAVRFYIEQSEADTPSA